MSNYNKIDSGVELFLVETNTYSRRKVLLKKQEVKPKRDPASKPRNTQPGSCGQPTKPRLNPPGPQPGPTRIAQDSPYDKFRAKIKRIHPTNQETPIYKVDPNALNVSRLAAGLDDRTNRTTYHEESTLNLPQDSHLPLPVTPSTPILVPAYKEQYGGINDYT